MRHSVALIDPAEGALDEDKDQFEEILK